MSVTTETIITAIELNDFSSSKPTDVQQEPILIRPVSGSDYVNSQHEAIVESDDQLSEQSPTGASFWLIIFTMAVVLVLVGLDNNIVATAVPRITDEFHTTADVGWYASAFRLCMCSFQFMFGKMYRLFSIKWIFMLAIAIFLAGSVLCACAPTSTTFVVGRAVTGLACAGLIAGCFNMVTKILPLRRRPVFNAILAAVESGAAMVSPVLGGYLTDALSWRWCFWINLPMGGLALVLSAIFFTDPTRPDIDTTPSLEKIAELDLVGNVLFVPSLTSLFIALSWARTRYSWDDPKIIGLLITFVVLLGAFIYEQRRRGDSAAIPVRIIMQRSVLAGCLYSMCTNSAMSVLEYYLPTYYQSVREYSAARSGLMILPIILGFLVGMVLHGTGTSMFGYYKPFMLFASILMPVAAGLMTTWKVDTTFAHLLIYPAVAGFAGGIGFQAPQSGVQTKLPARDATLGLSVILFAQNFGPAVFVVVAQTILTNQLAKNLNALIPGLSAAMIENNGLTDLKNKVPLADRGKLLAGIDQSLTQTWYLVIGLTCATMIGSVFMEWGSVKQKRA